LAEVGGKHNIVCLVTTKLLTFFDNFNSQFYPVQSIDTSKMKWAVYLKGELIKELKTDNLSKENLQNLTVYFKELKNAKT
jgi:hypothetical protein